MSFSEGVYNDNPDREDGGIGREVHICGELTESEAQKGTEIFLSPFSHGLPL